MLPEMTPAVSRAVQASQQRAHSRGASEVGPPDLLHGLLDEEDGRAARLLAGAGADVAAVRASLVIEPIVPQPETSAIPLSSLCQTILLRAAELAVDSTAEHTVASDALLVALVRADESLRRFLEEHGWDAARFDAQFQSADHSPLELDEPLSLAEPTERVDLARLLDAGANRAREALRVIEDFCRFALDDAYLSREAKQMRHDLAAALADLPMNLLLEA